MAILCSAKAANRSGLTQALAPPKDSWLNTKKPERLLHLDLNAGEKSRRTENCFVELEIFGRR